jgi:uridylate kinase
MSGKYKRILLKISGEALMGDQSFGHDPQIINRICADIKTVFDQGTQICLVVGGGNIFRGRSAEILGIERASADYMGMLATVINALALQSRLESLGVHTRVQSAVPMLTISEAYIRRKAIRHMEKGRLVIFAAGTGHPYFTTDAAAALRGSEMNCDAILKGTKVDGVYSADPALEPDAQFYSHLSYRDVITNDLKVMDTAAITLARDNHIPIIVFNIYTQGALTQVLNGQGKFTVIE